MLSFREQARIVLAQHCGGLLVISGASHGRTHPISGKNVKSGDCRVVNEVESCPLIDGEGGTDQTGSENVVLSLAAQQFGSVCQFCGIRCLYRWLLP